MKPHLKAELIKEVHRDGCSCVLFSTIRKLNITVGNFIREIKRENRGFKAKLNDNSKTVTFSK